MKKKVITGIIFALTVLLSGCKEGSIQEAEIVNTTSEPTILHKESETVYMQEDMVLSNGISYGIKYNLKINPELDIYADDDLIVVEVQALNDDAEKLLENMDILKMDVVSAVDYIVSESRTRGYMTEEKGNTVDLTIEEINEAVMGKCPECGGCGTVECSDCHGTHYFTCEACGGGKVRVCEHCGGNNQAKENGEEISVVPCHNCNGSLWVECDSCHGSGRGANNCSHCGGGGVCQACFGTGSIDVTAGDGPHKGEVVGKDACFRCHGSGVCQNCKGESDSYCPSCCEHNGPDGTIQNQGGVPGRVLCNSCNGTGVEEIRTGSPAGGDNSANCEYCNGTGYYSCEACGGTGGYSCNCELNGYRWCGSCHGSGIQNVD